MAGFVILSFWKCDNSGNCFDLSVTGPAVAFGPWLILFFCLISLEIFEVTFLRNKT